MQQNVDRDAEPGVEIISEAGRADGGLDRAEARRCPQRSAEPIHLLRDLPARARLRPFAEHLRRHAREAALFFGLEKRARAAHVKFRNDRGKAVVLEDQHRHAVRELALDRPLQLALEHFLRNRRAVFFLDLAERRRRGFLSEQPRRRAEDNDRGRKQIKASFDHSHLLVAPAADFGSVVSTVRLLGFRYSRATRWRSAAPTRSIFACTVLTSDGSLK